MPIKTLALECHPPHTAHPKPSARLRTALVNARSIFSPTEEDGCIPAWRERASATLSTP
ncbi:MAG: hypothetical protein QNL01_00865 [Akkermansiaceae bacterium]